ncbi:MAG: hypothetical protein HC772_04970, partial [Leptolyngbyaceae cyanobacterium CRU_2_3]|nr:hypothetical protein [Leptolyngbyaceae cyanobacterium CRU_2_3]
VRPLLCQLIPTGGELQINTFTLGKQSTQSLEQGTTEPQSRPTRAVAMDPTGGFVVVWTSQSQDDPNGLLGGGGGVYAQRYDNTGNPVGLEFQINTTVTLDQDTPSIAMDASGNFVVTWTSFQGGAARQEVLARRYDKNGTPLSDEVIVNTFFQDAQQNSSIAMNATGEYIITWSSERQDAGGAGSWGVYAQRYNADGTKRGLSWPLTQELPLIPVRRFWVSSRVLRCDRSRW